MAVIHHTVIPRIAAPVRHEVTARLRTEIIEAKIPQGARLRERDLCEAFGVSRTVIRESLRQLEAEHLVDIISGVGPIVHEISAREATELYAVREALEGLAGALAASHARSDEAACQRLITLTQALTDEVSHLGAETPSDRDTDALLRIKQEFYTALLRLAGSAVLEEMHSSLQARISRLRWLSVSHKGRPQKMASEIESITSQIVQGNEESARQACIEHVRSAHSAATADDVEVR